MKRHISQICFNQNAVIILHDYVCGANMMYTIHVYFINGTRTTPTKCHNKIHHEFIMRHVEKSFNSSECANVFNGNKCTRPAKKMTSKNNQEARQNCEEIKYVPIAAFDIDFKSILMDNQYLRDINVVRINSNIPFYSAK